MTSLTAAYALFVDMIGHEPDGVWSAPGRVNLIGEHTDYNEGYVLPFAIAQRTHAAVGRRDDGVVRARSTFADHEISVDLDDLDALFPTPVGERLRLPEWAAYVLGVVWALRQSHASEACGVDIAISSDVPVGAGLSSSAALECAIATALHHLWGLRLPPAELARIGRRAENDAVGTPTGIMDQLASMLGQPDAATFVDCRTQWAASVPAAFAAAEVELLVIDTLVRHSHASGGYRERRVECDRATSALGVRALRDVRESDLPAVADTLDEKLFRRVRHVVTENRRVLDAQAALANHGPRAIGDLLTASHASLRDDFEVSVPELDTAVDAALVAGALGARMTGGGFGGCAIALVENSTVDAVTSAVRRAFSDAGFAAPQLFTVSPSAGARRDQ